MKKEPRVNWIWDDPNPVWEFVIRAWLAIGVVALILLIAV